MAFVLERISKSDHEKYQLTDIWDGCPLVYFEWRGLPPMIRCDNGPEYISNVTQAWAKKRGIHIEFIQPG